MSTSTLPTSAPSTTGGLGKPPRSAFRQWLSKVDVKVSPYLYISPFYIVFAIVGLFPLLYTAYVSVHQWHLIGGKGDFVGMENFTWVLQQPNFWRALRNTFSIFLLSSVPQVIIAVIIAALLDANLRAKTFWRMGVLLPFVVAPVAVSLIFGKLFADQSGVVNTILKDLGFNAIGWHAEVVPSHLAIATMVNFRWTGYNTLIFLAAMQAVPRDLYEAAVIDGASRLRQFFSVTIPSIRPTMIFVIITSTIGGLQIFDEPFTYDQYHLGGSDRQWLTVTMYLRDVGWGSTKSFGKASAVAWLLFLIILIIGMINFWMTQRISSADAPKKKSRKKVAR